MDEKNRLLKEWLKFKKAEDAAKNKRIAAETELEKIYGGFSETSKTITEEELGYKINLKKNIVHKLDQAGYLSIRGDIPEKLRPEKVTFALDVPGFNYLRESNNPEEIEIYKKISELVEIKENKTTIKVEKI